MTKIMIAPGHGGRDPGAVANGLAEKNLNLTTGLACRDYLRDNFTGHQIYMTRTTDTFVSLPDQRELARKHDVDIFVDVHYNAFHEQSANGFETFIFSGEVFPETERNQRKIHNTCMDYLETLGIRDRGRKRSRHWTVTNIPTSVVLVEGMFLTNAREADILKQPNVLKNIGGAIGHGVALSYRLPKKEQQKPPKPPEELPEIQRMIRVEIDGKMTNIPAYLIDGSTYIHGAPLVRALGYQISGHGDHVKIGK